MMTSEEDEFNPSLAAMENEIKPKVLKTIVELNEKTTIKLIKYQTEKLECDTELSKYSLELQRKKVMKKL